MGPRTHAARALCLALLALGQAHADPSAEVRGSFGPGIWSAGGTVNADLGGAWALSAANDYTTVTNTSAPSLTDLAALDLSYAFSTAWQLKAGLDFSNDSVNQILFVGPDLGFTYAAKTAAPTRAKSPKGDSDEGDEEEEPDTAWSLAFSAPIHAYTVNLGANSSAGLTRQSKKTASVAYVLTSDGTDLYITQFNPNLTLLVPLFGGAWQPSLLYGHDFYNKDPGVAAYVINRRFSVGNGSYRVGSLVSALYTDTVTAALTVKLPWKLTLNASLSESQLISPYIWVATPEITLGAALGAGFTLKAGWTDTIEPGSSTPQVLASLSAVF